MSNHSASNTIENFLQSKLSLWRHFKTQNPDS